MLVYVSRLSIIGYVLDWC